MSRISATSFKLTNGLRDWLDSEVEKGNFVSRSEIIRTSIMLLKVLTEGKDQHLVKRLKDMLLREWPVR